MKKFILLFLGCYSFCVNAQQVPIGQWRTHLPYNNVLSVAQSDTKIFCATTGGVFHVEIATGEITKRSTIDGLADVNTKLLAWDDETQHLLIAYKNAKLDLIKGNQIYHLNDIFDKTSLGNKRINAITFRDGLAYLSCGFGVVVYDLKRREVKDTYFIGSTGVNLEVFDLVIADGRFFVSTDDGVYQTELNNPALPNPNGWRKHAAPESYPGGLCSSLVNFNENVYGLFDTGIYKLINDLWKLTPIFRPDVKKLKASKNHLLAITPFRLISYDTQEAISKIIQNTSQFNNVNDALIGNQQNFYLADAQKGLVVTSNGDEFSFLFPNGPQSLNVKELNYSNNKIFLSPGAISSDFGPVYNNDGFSFLSKELWESKDGISFAALQEVRDIVTTVYSPEEKMIYLGSYVNGVLALSENGDLKTYDQQNSSLQLTVGDPTNIRVNGLGFDSKKNLWVTQFGVKNPLSVKSIDGQWKAYDFPNDLLDPVTTVTGLLVDEQDNKWLKLRYDGLLIYDGSKTRKMGFSSNNGGIPGTIVNTLVNDKEGSVWIGTDAGVAVVYSPVEVFLGAKAEIPQLVQDGFLKPLLAAQNINCIAVDAANRKWIGTDNGVWLFNQAGNKQLLFFNKDNSPLLSNKVLTIAIDDSNGEVFFGTANGIISYKGDATAPTSKMEKVVIYPNPVRPGFSGNIGIKGLSEGAHVKITDINGSLVYETTANGGQAIWDGKNFSNREAASGVYLVLIASKDGSDTAVAKILIVR